MKYKIGDKVKYDGGDWWFYGTVSAVFEHSICPCYRLSVERMEKKSCKFSITQFEFELEADSDLVSGKDKRKRENAEVEYLKRMINPEFVSEQTPVPEKKKRKTRKPELKQETGGSTNTAERQSSPKKQTKKVRTRKITEEWERNLESYKNGEKKSIISAWAALNRKQYKTGTLSDEKIERLVKINFPFDVGYKKKAG